MTHGRSPQSRIREVQDFPTPGVGFKDITPLLADPVALQQTIADLSSWVRDKERRRGARAPRRAGSSSAPRSRPRRARASSRRGGRESFRRRRSARPTCSSTARTSLEVHPDLIPPGARVVIHDDVLATGGTVEAICGLVEQLGGEVVGACFIIELTFLGGRERLGRARRARR